MSSDEFEDFWSLEKPQVKMKSVPTKPVFKSSAKAKSKGKENRQPREKKKKSDTIGPLFEGSMGKSFKYTTKINLVPDSKDESEDEKTAGEQISEGMTS